MTSPRGFVPGAVLTEVMAATDCILEEGRGSRWSVRLLIEREDGSETVITLDGG